MRKTMLSAATAALLLLTACGSGSGSDAKVDENADKGLPVTGETVTYNPNSLVNDGEVIEMEMWTWASQERLQALADEYQEIHPNVDINVVLQPWEDYWTKLPLELNNGRGPALFNVHNSHHENLIRNLEPYDIPVEELTADYRNVESHVIDGKVHYLDYGLMTGLVFYNKTMWEKAGLGEDDIPETWDELTEVAKKLTVRNGDTITQAGFNYNGAFKEFSLGLPYQQGQNLMNEDMVTPNLDTPEMMATIEQFLNLYNVDKVGSKDFGPVAAESFGQGQTAMMYNWGHQYGTLSEQYPELDFGTFRTPVPEAGVDPYALDRYNGESTLGINAGASDAEKAVAQDFTRFYLTNKEFVKDMSLANSVFPLYAPLAEDPEVLEHPVLSALGDLDRYIWPGALPSTFETSIDTMWQNILYNGAAPEQALAEAQAAVEADLAKSEFVSVEDRYEFYTPAP